MKRGFLKKFGAVALAAGIMISGLTGCGNNEEQPGSTPDTQSGTESTESESVPDGQEQAGNENAGADEDEGGDWTGEVDKIVVTFLTAGVEPADLGIVQDAINEISIKKVGVEVEFKPVSIFEAPATVPMWIGGGEQIDLFCIAFAGVSPFVSMNMVEPMTDLLAENAPFLEEYAKENPLYFETGGEVYGVRVMSLYQGSGGGYLFSKEALEKAEFTYQDGDMVTLDDLGEIFGKLKELYPNSYPCGAVGSAPRSDFSFINDALGATRSSGVLVGLDSTEVVNYYATEQYKSYIEHLRDWYLKGYVLQDAATTDITLSENMKSKVFLGYFNDGSPQLREDAGIVYGKECIHLMLVEPYIPAVSPSMNEYWTIPVTAKEPEAAARFLNLAYSDPELNNIYQYGVEGIHYEKTGDNTISFLDRRTSSYAIPGQMGRYEQCYYVGNDTSDEDSKWNETALSRKTKGYGFVYDGTAMTNQITAIDAVVAQYTAALETGSVDIDTAYPEFLQKLEEAGINDVIADKQAQFDAWRNQ